jgi:hypothetical protein
MHGKSRLREALAREVLLANRNLYDVEVSNSFSKELKELGGIGMV